MKKDIKTQKESYKLFKKIYENEWQNLTNNSNTIFENLSYNLDIDKEYNKFEKSDKYKEFLATNSKADRMKLIQKYFYENSIIPIINVVSEVLERSGKSNFVNELLIEETYEYIEKKSLSGEELAWLKELEEMEVVGRYLKNLWRSGKDIYNLVKENFLPLYLFGMSFGSKNVDILLRLFFVYNTISIDKHSSSKILGYRELESISKQFDLNFEKIFKDCARVNDFYRMFPSSEFRFIQFIYSKMNELREKMILNNYYSRFKILRKEFLKARNDPEKAIKIFNFLFCIHSKIINQVLGYIKFVAENNLINKNLITKSKQFLNKSHLRKIENLKEIFNLSEEATEFEKKFEYALLILVQYYKIFNIDLEQNLHGSYLEIEKDFKIKFKNLINQAFDELYIDLERAEQYAKSNTTNKPKNKINNESTKPKKESIFDI